MASWYCLAAAFAVFSRSLAFCPARLAARARFLQYVYTCRSCVRSWVHHRFAYGDGLALGVSARTASSTADINLSVFCCTVLPTGLTLSVSVILLLISFQGAFFNRCLSSCFGP